MKVVVVTVFILNIFNRPSSCLSTLRHLHCPSGWTLPGFWAADSAAGRARAGRPVRVQPQRPETADSRRAKRRFRPWELPMRGLSVPQPDPATEERRPRGAGEDRGPAGHFRIQGDPLHLQRHLPVRATGQEIAGAQPSGADKDWFVPRLLDSRKRRKSSFRPVSRDAAATSPRRAREDLQLMQLL